MAERIFGDSRSVVSSEREEVPRPEPQEVVWLRAQLDALLNCAPAFILALDRDGKIRFINRTMGRDRNEIIGTDWLRYVSSNDHARLSALLRAVIETGQPQVYETTTTDLDGTPRWFSSHMGVMPFGERDRGVVVIAQDVTELKRTQAEFAAAQRLATAGTLAAGVAHEINTPVQFVNDSLHFLRNAARDVFTLLEKLLVVQRVAERGPVSGDLAAALADVAAAQEEIDLDYIRQNVPRAFERCIDGLTRVATIVRSMKEFAHPAQREMAPVDLNRAVRNTLTLAQNEFRYVAKLETELGEIPPVVCHASDINQVVLNLVVNAAHAITDAVRGTNRKGTLTVRTWREGDRAVIAVGDTGGGIPEAIQHRVFDPFFTTKRVGQGTGQGLSLAWAIVKEKHGGELTFETKPGEGTTFFVRLPLRGKKPAGEEGST
jgi:PAS domain S-box-containing protein